MIKEEIGTGSSIESALSDALLKLGLNEGKDVYNQEILELPKKGLFGIGTKDAKVRVWFDDGKPAPKKLEKKPVTKEEKIVKSEKSEQKKKVKVEETPLLKADVSKKAQTAKDYLQKVINKMNLPEVEVTCDTEGKNVCLHINNDEKGITIGHRGETLNALQYLTGLAANRVDGDFARLTVDSGTYREKRRKTLEILAKRIAHQVVRTGVSQTLEPMTPYERRIIHSAVAEVNGATSSSEGEEPKRYVIISSLTPDKGKGEKPKFEKKKFSHKREKAEPYIATKQREVAPTEAGDMALYGKIEL